MKESLETSQTTKTGIAVWTISSTPSYRFEKNWNTNLKRHRHPDVHSSIVYNSQDMETS